MGVQTDVFWVVTLWHHVFRQWCLRGT